MRYIVLLHLIDWPPEETDRFKVDDGFFVGRFDGSLVHSEYHKFCRSMNWDDGEPFEFGSFFSIEANQGQRMIDGGPDSVVARACNLAVLALGEPLGLTRVVEETDDGRFTGFTTLVADYQPAKEWLLDLDVEGWDSESLSMLRRLWITDSGLRKHYAKNRRLITALDYFFDAWHGHYLEHVALNLGVGLEALFSPSDQTELSHQVSFNAACLLAEEPTRRKEVYDAMRAFYRVRSSIVHGDQPNVDRMAKQVPTAFGFLRDALKQILVDENLCRSFVDQKLRRSLFRRWLFQATPSPSPGDQSELPSE
jgi:hypothetical protein